MAVAQAGRCLAALISRHTSRPSQKTLGSQAGRSPVGKIDHASSRPIHKAAPAPQCLIYQPLEGNHFGGMETFLKGIPVPPLTTRSNSAAVHAAMPLASDGGGAACAARPRLGTAPRALHHGHDVSGVSIARPSPTPHGTPPPAPKTSVAKRPSFRDAFAWEAMSTPPPGSRPMLSASGAVPSPKKNSREDPAAVVWTCT